MDPKDIVRKGYDQASYHYRSDAEMDLTSPGSDTTLHYHQWLDRLEPELPPNARILELGCGCGLPVARRLAAKFIYTGIDLSPVQCTRAKDNAPAADIRCDDMSAVDFPGGSFDAVLAFFSIIHVPLPEQPALFQRMAAWLQPGGFLMITVPLTIWTGTEENWHGSGAEMYWSHTDTATYLQWLEDLGFETVWSHFLPEGDQGFNTILARKILP